MNKQRERLVELLDNGSLDYSSYSTEMALSGNYEMESIGQFLADKILADGWMRPPCKVGDKVYVIEPCNCYNNYSEYDKCRHRRTKATKWLDMVRVPTKHYTKCLKLFERPFKVEYLNKIGKTVFLSREEAEAKLKGGVQDA